MHAANPHLLHGSATKIKNSNNNVINIVRMYVRAARQCNSRPAKCVSMPNVFGRFQKYAFIRGGALFHKVIECKTNKWINVTPHIRSNFGLRSQARKSMVSRSNLRCFHHFRKHVQSTYWIMFVTVAQLTISSSTCMAMRPLAIWVGTQWKNCRQWFLHTSQSEGVFSKMAVSFSVLASFQ